MSESASATDATVILEAHWHLARVVKCGCFSAVFSCSFIALPMSLEKVIEGGKWLTETMTGFAKAVASPNAPVPKTDLHPRLVARPWTAQEFVCTLFSRVFEI